MISDCRNDDFDDGCTYRQTAGTSGIKAGNGAVFSEMFGGGSCWRRVLLGQYCRDSIAERGRDLTWREARMCTQVLLSE